MVGNSVREAAERVSDEVVTILAGAVVRDRSTGVRRPAMPADIAILFRSRDSHRDFEAALDRRGVSTYVYKGLGFFDADEVQDAWLCCGISPIRCPTFARRRSCGRGSCVCPTLPLRLTPRVSQMRFVGRSRSSARWLDEEDQRLFALVRAFVPAWLMRVDRDTPAELFAHVLRDTAYAFELRGRRHRQARENLKKFRAMIRRAQNRGYPTLSRLADHLDRLAVGDESNAAIDAVDAVSLMTVHAAKGLEFPIVFIVNMARGTGGSRPAIRVGVTGEDEASVSIADYQSEADEDASAREREETKRLLYVALTRARDRLYLSAALKDGRIRPGPGSLSQVLPDEVRALFAAAAGVGEVAWGGGKGARHLFTVPQALAEPRQLARALKEPTLVDDFDPL